jgi:uncharacterized protein
VPDGAAGDVVRRECESFLNKWGPYHLTRDALTVTDVRRFCQVAEDSNPVYWDEDFARTTRFGRVIAPPQSLFSMSSFGAWWTPEHVKARQAEETAALNAGTSDEDSRIFEVLERHGYVVNTVASQQSEYIAPFGPGDGRIKMRSMTTDISPEKKVRVGLGVFVTSVTEYRTEVGDRLIGRATRALLRYKAV